MVLVVVLLVVALVFLLLKNIPLFGVRLPPGPNAMQVLWNFLELKKRPHVAFANFAKIYGPLMSLRLGSRVIIVASSASAAKEILQTQDRNLSGRYLPRMYYNVPDAQHSSIALARECDQPWKFLRGMGNSFMFSAKCVEGKAETRKVRVVEAVEYLQKKVGEVVNVEEIFSVTYINIIANMLVSRNLFDISTREDEHSGKVKILISEVVKVVSSLGLSDLFTSLETLDFLTLRKAAKLKDRVVRIWGDIVRERRRRRRAKRDVSSAGDFLDGLLAETTFSDEQICFIFLEELIAGTESTIITSVWLMVELIRHPQILQRVRDEIAKAFEGDCTQINESILSDSHYFQACIKETLRIHIPGPFLVPHRAIETCKIDNYIIPKDCIVLVNAWAINMEPTTWKDPTIFNPDRFINSKIDFKSSDDFGFLAFGAGRRMCPGYNLAIKNVQVLVASLVHHFEWTLSDGSDPINIDTKAEFGTVLKKEIPLSLIPTMI